MRDFPVHGWEHVTVCVERDCYRGMAQHLRHLLRIHVATQQKARGGMAKIVEPNAGKTSDGQERPQFPIELDGMQVTARCSTEHQIALDPERSSVKTLLDLASSMLAECLNSQGSYRDTPPGPG